MLLLRTILSTLLISAASLCAEPVSIVPKDIADAVQPQVCVAPGGRVHVVFGAGNALYHTSSPDGRAYSAPVKIGELEKLALRMRRGPRVTATDDVIAVTAISHASGTLHGWTSADGGKTWKDGGALNSVQKSAREGMHGMAGDGKGLVAVTWLDMRSGKTELWSRASRDGGRSWESEVRVYASPDGTICECCHASVAIGPKGEIAAMWRNWLGGSRDIWMAVSMDGGKTFPNPQKMGTGSWVLKGCPMDGGSIAFDASGKPITVWRRESKIFSAAPGQPEKQLADAALQPVVARAQSGTAIAYEQGGKIMLAQGTQPARVFAKGRIPAMGANGKATYLAWESEPGIMIERLP